MPETLLIGLVGGLGPAATVHYYRGLLAACERRGVALRLIVNQASVDMCLNLAGRGDATALADYLAGFLDEMIRAGAKVLAIPAVTPHICMPELAGRFATPILDMIDLVEAEVRRRGVPRIALMGTRTTVMSRLFHRLDLTAVDPAQTEVQRVHDIYVGIVQKGRGDTADADELRLIAQDYVRTLGVDLIILAGTEFSLLPPATWSGVNVLDCAALHIDALIEMAAPAPA